MSPVSGKLFVSDVGWVLRFPPTSDTQVGGKGFPHLPSVYLNDEFISFRGGRGDTGPKWFRCGEGNWLQFKPDEWPGIYIC